LHKYIFLEPIRHLVRGNCAIIGTGEKHARSPIQVASSFRRVQVQQAVFELGSALTIWDVTGMSGFEYIDQVRHKLTFEGPSRVAGRAQRKGRGRVPALGIGYRQSSSQIALSGRWEEALVMLIDLIEKRDTAELIAVSE
jgi:hypothetical protein